MGNQQSKMKSKIPPSPPEIIHSRKMQQCFEGESPFLKLPAEIILIIMNYLVMEARYERDNIKLVYEKDNVQNKSRKLSSFVSKTHTLTSLLKAHSKLYNIGLMAYYNDIMSPLMLSPYDNWGRLTKSEGIYRNNLSCAIFSNYPHLISKKSLIKINNRFPYGCNHPIFRRYPQISEVGSIEINDYCGTNIPKRWFSNINYSFLSNLRKQLYLFNNLNSIHIEVGHHENSTLLVDLLLYLPLPVGLKSLSIIINSEILFNRDVLHNYNTRFLAVHNDIINLSETSHTFPYLKYLKIGFSKGNLPKATSDIGRLLSNLSYSTNRFLSVLFGFQQLFALLRHLVFKHGKIMLQHLVLENISPYLIFKKQNIVDFLLPHREYVIDSFFYGHFIGLTWWIYSEQYGTGLPKLQILEVNNKLQQHIFYSLYSPIFHREEDLVFYRLLRNYKFEIINCEWIHGFLRRESSHGWEQNNRDHKAVIVFDREYVIDCASTYAEIERLEERGRTVDLLNFFDLNSDFRIPLKKINCREWKQLLKDHNLGSD